MPEPLRAALLKLGDFGFPQPFRSFAAGDDAAARSALLQQARHCSLEDGKRVDRERRAGRAPAATDARARREQLFERMRAVFGSSFVALPLFTCDTAPRTSWPRACRQHERCRAAIR